MSSTLSCCTVPQWSVLKVYQSATAALMQGVRGMTGWLTSSSHQPRTELTLPQSGPFHIPPY